MIPQPVTDHDGRILWMRNLRFTYESGVEALKGVNLAIDGGEYVAVVGGNGSGKTTLAKHMNGLLRPTSGQIHVSGVLASTRTVAELARVVGYVFQNPDHQLFCRSVREEVSFGPVNTGIVGDELDRRVGTAIDAMGLREVVDRPPLSLTLGLRRRVSIASVLAMDPPMLVLDEPTTGLDLRETEELMARVKAMNSEGRTIVLITHEMKLVARNADRVVVMSDGKIVLDSDTRGVFSDIELLGQSRLRPPPVTVLAHQLASLGVSRSVLTPEELVFGLSRGGRR